MVETGSFPAWEAERRREVWFSRFAVSSVLPRLPQIGFTDACIFTTMAFRTRPSVHVHAPTELRGYCTRSVKNVPLRRFRPDVALRRAKDINHHLDWRGWFADCRGQTYMIAPRIEPCQVFKLPIGSRYIQRGTRGEEKGYAARRREEARTERFRKRDWQRRERRGALTLNQLESSKIQKSQRI